MVTEDAQSAMERKNVCRSRKGDDDRLDWISEQVGDDEVF